MAALEAAQLVSAAYRLQEAADILDNLVANLPDGATKEFSEAVAVRTRVAAVKVRAEAALICPGIPLPEAP